MKKRIGEAFMSADAYGRSLPRGVGVNLLVPEIEPMATFLREVLCANVLYADPDFAALVIEGSPVMLHADHTYLDHKLHGIVSGIEAREQASKSASMAVIQTAPRRRRGRGAT